MQLSLGKLVAAVPAAVVADVLKETAERLLVASTPPSADYERLAETLRLSSEQLQLQLAKQRDLQVRLNLELTVLEPKGGNPQ